MVTAAIIYSLTKEPYVHYFGSQVRILIGHHGHHKTTTQNPMSILNVALLLSMLMVAEMQI